MPVLPQIDLTKFWTALGEALKEIGRLMFAAIVPPVGQLIITHINTNTGDINIPWKLVWAVTLYMSVTILLRAADRFVHTWNKLQNPQKFDESMGIIPW